VHAARNIFTPGATPLWTASSRPEYLWGRSRRDVSMCGRVHTAEKAVPMQHEQIPITERSQSECQS